MACQDYQLCSGIKVIIDFAMHGVQDLWGGNLTTENWVFLLVDTKKSFNDINLVVMPWTIRHLWTSGASFFFN